MTDLRVLFLSLYNPHEVGYGAANHLHHLSQELVKLGCEIHILTIERKTARVLDGVQIHTFKSPALIPIGRGLFFSLFSVRRIEGLCKKYNVDLVHGQSPSSAGYACLRRNKLPFIVTLHSTSFGEISSFFTISSKRGVSLSTVYTRLFIQSLSTLLTSIECKRANKVVTVSKSLAREAVDYYHLPKNKVVPIHNGVDLPDPPTQKQDMRPMILSVGRLGQEKGHEYLISAMPQILKTFSDARLQLAGKGAYRKYLEVLIKKFKIDKSIDFLGQVSKEQLYSLYANASVVVQPSIYESFGTPIVEAMSMGKPVVASCVGGIPELITNGKEGLLVEPRNSLQLARAITKILSDESLRKKLASNARKRVAREFTWKTIAKKTIELYEQTLDGC